MSDTNIDENITYTYNSNDNENTDTDEEVVTEDIAVIDNDENGAKSAVTPSKVVAAVAPTTTTQENTSSITSNNSLANDQFPTKVNVVNIPAETTQVATKAAGYGAKCDKDNVIASQPKRVEESPPSPKGTRSMTSTIPTKDENNSTLSSHNDVSDDKDDDFKDMDRDDEKDMDEDEKNEHAGTSEDQKNALSSNKKTIQTEKGLSSWSWNEQSGLIMKSLWYKHLNDLVLDPKRLPFDWNWLYISLENAVKEYNNIKEKEEQQHFDKTYLQNFAKTTVRYTWLGKDAMKSRTYYRPDNILPTYSGTIPTEEWINWYKNNIHLKINEYMIRNTISNGDNNSSKAVNNKRPILGSFLSDGQRLKGLENLLITARDGNNSWAGSLAHGCRTTWFNNYTWSLFLDGACLSNFEPMSPRQTRAKFREAEKLAKDKYRYFCRNKITDWSTLPQWVKLFFSFFDWNNGKIIIPSALNNVTKTVSDPNPNPIRYMPETASATTTPMKINDAENNMNGAFNDTPIACATIATLANQNHSNVSDVTQQIQQHQIIAKPDSQIQEAGAEKNIAAIDTTSTTQVTSSRSAATRPLSPSSSPPNKRHKISNGSDTPLLEQQQLSINNNNNIENPITIQAPIITIRPFTQIFADAMMVRQRLNASMTLNNNDDVRFYKNCLDAIESEIETYKYLQNSLRHMHNNNNGNNNSHSK